MTNDVQRVKEEVRSLLQTHSDRSIATILRNRGYTNKKTADIRKIRLDNSKENELDNAITIILNQNSNVKKDVIIKLLKNIDSINDRLDSIEYVSRNGKSQRWNSIPQSNHERSYDDFRKNYPKETLNRFLLSMGGTVSQGLAILTTYYQRSYQSNHRS